jgi:hypothetical protein
MKKKKSRMSYKSSSHKKQTQVMDYGKKAEAEQKPQD